MKPGAISLPMKLAILGVLFGSFACAQKQRDEAVFRTDARLVVLHATVADRSGHLLTSLPQSAFRVYENGAEQKIKIFQQEDVPVSMGLIIDNSGSMRDKRMKVEASALTLVKASNPKDEIFVVNFNDEAFLDTPDFTNDISVVEKSLARIDSRGGTAMRDAIHISIDHEKQKAKRSKRVLLVVTDGNDNASRISSEDLLKAAQQSGILIYGIGLLSEEHHREAKRAKGELDRLTEASGGQSYYPKEVSDIETICQQVAHDIRNQYTITYTPTNQALDGAFRQVRVTVDDAGNPLVRTRTGYYASPGGL
jgi:Ca-activated chloride channel family protein